MKMNKTLTIVLALVVLASVEAAGEIPEIVVLDDARGLPVPTVLRGATSYPEGGGAGAPEGIVNGDFTADLDGWSATESGGGAAPGGVAVIDGAAEMAEGDSFLVTLEQTFSVPEGVVDLAIALALDPGFDLAASSIPDALEISLLDAGGTPLLSTWNVLATSTFNLQEDGTVNSTSDASWDGAVITLHISSIAQGTVATLFVDLIGGDEDTGSAVRLDDIELVTPPEPDSFRRGDVGGDGEVDETDEALILDALFGAELEPPGCLGGVYADAADVNDNENLTIADVLAASAIDERPDCLTDTTEDTRGFELVDPDWIVTTGALEIEPDLGAIDRVARLPLLVSGPLPARGATLIIEYDADALTPFDSDLGDASDVFTSELGESRVMVGDGIVVATLWNTDAAAPLTAGSGAPERIGELVFHLADFAAIGAFIWRTDAEVDGVPFDATVVDEILEDHRPTNRSGEFAFVRGNSNGDVSVDISDSVYTLNFLFTGGPDIECEDAADTNNDSQVDISDPVFGLNYLFNGGPGIPAPFPLCGLDEGPVDLLGCGPTAPCGG